MLTRTFLSDFISDYKFLIFIHFIRDSIILFSEYTVAKFCRTCVLNYLRKEVELRYKPRLVELHLIEV